MELGMRDKALASQITQPFSIQTHCCSVSTELLAFTTPKKNSEEPELYLQKQNSPFQNQQAKFQKNLVHLIDLWLQ